MGKGRDCEMVERAEDEEKKARSFQGQRADQIETNSPNEALRMSGANRNTESIDYLALWKSR